MLLWTDLLKQRIYLLSLLGALLFRMADNLRVCFERQEYHLGSGKEVFPEVHKRVAWEIEGLLISY